MVQNPPSARKIAASAKSADVNGMGVNITNLVAGQDDTGMRSTEGRESSSQAPEPP